MSDHDSPALKESPASSSPEDSPADSDGVANSSKVGKLDMPSPVKVKEREPDSPVAAPLTKEQM